MIILIGASASGKTEVAKILRTKYNLQKVITHTTRPMRVNEVNGIDYFFVDEKEFRQLAFEGKFIETTKYNGNYYGTSRAQVKDDKVLIIDPNGLKAFRDIGDSHIVSFLFQVDQITRYNRMIERGDDANAAHKRIINDQSKFTLSNVGRTDYIIDSENFNLDEVCEKVYSLYIHTLNSK